MAMGFRSAEATKACLTSCTRGGTTTGGLAARFFVFLFCGEVLAGAGGALDGAWAGGGSPCGTPGTGNEIRERRTSAARLGCVRTAVCLPGEIPAHDRGIILRQDADHFLIEVVAAGGGSLAVTLLVSGAALLDVFPQAVVEVALLPALVHFGLVVELDLIHQQLGEALGFLVDFLVLGGDLGLLARVRGRRRRLGGAGLRL